jgi:hypothetical protein
VAVGRYKSTSLNITRSALEVLCALILSLCRFIVREFIPSGEGRSSWYYAKYGWLGAGSFRCVLSGQGFMSSGFHPEYLSVLLTAKPNMAKSTKYPTDRTSNLLLRFQLLI